MSRRTGRSARCRWVRWRFLLLAGAAGSPAWLAAQAPRTGPILISTSRTDVLLVPAQLETDPGTAAAINDLLASCRGNMRIAVEDSGRASVAHAWGGTAAARTPLQFSLVVIPSEPLAMPCARTDERARFAAMRGLRITRDTAYVPDRDVRRVEVHRGEQRLEPVALEQGVVTRLTPSGLSTAGMGVVRLTLSLDQVAPPPSGRADELVLRVWSESDQVAQVITIPSASVEALWRSAFAARTAAAASAAVPPDRLTLLPPPSNAELAAAHRAYEAGDIATANGFILAAMDGRGLSRPDRRSALMHLGLGFVALGDEGAARIALHEALAASPCLTLHASAPAAARTIFDGLERPAVRCRAKGLASTAIRGALLPGFGRPVDVGRGVANAVLIGAIAGGIVQSASGTATARESYDLYLQATSAEEATRLYNRADGQRRDARLVGQAALGIWAALVVEGVAREFLLARELRRVQDYGWGPGRASAASFRATPILAPGRVGIAFTSTTGGPR